MADLSIPQKQCSKCKEWFPATKDYFFVRKHRSIGLTPRCKTCQSITKRQRTANSPYNLDRLRLKNAGVKRCKTCKCEKPATNEYFGKYKHGRDGLSPHCKSCANAKTREYRNNNPEIREREKQKQREYMQRPEVRSKRKLHDQKRRTDPVFRQRERDAERKRLKTEHGRALKQAAYERRRARLLGAEGTYTAADVNQQYRSQKGKCWHCGKELNGKYEVDHLIPLTRGGSNKPGNIVCSCAYCNRSKHNKLPQEWNGRLF